MTEISIKVFLDGAEIAAMARAAQNPLVSGFTTNPTLMHKVGITDYAGFAREALAAVGGKPISFEVFSDEFDEMEAEAAIIKDFGEATYVKIPITNTRGESSLPLIARLAGDGVKLNVTAMMTLAQVEGLARVLNPSVPSVVSVFAGRIADTGRDPVPLMQSCAAVLKDIPSAELLWASPRELLNIFQAQDCGCKIITVPGDILKKLSLVGKDLDQYSLETVQMFYADGKAAGFNLRG